MIVRPKKYGRAGKVNGIWKILLPNLSFNFNYNLVESLSLL